MSEFSPLRDPVFLLTWQVHLAVVILFALLGIWAGMTRRPWYIAPTLFLALLWLFVPLEAPEPAVVLLLTVPVLALACRIARRWLEKPNEDSRNDSQSRLRFSLADLLWFMVVMGMLTGLLVQVWRLPWETDYSFSKKQHELIIYWPEVALSATCFYAIAVPILIAVFQSTTRRRLLWMIGAGLIVLAAAGIHSAIVNKDWLLMFAWGARVPDSKVLLRLAEAPAYGDIFVVYLLGYLEFAVAVRLELPVVIPQLAVVSRRIALIVGFAGSVCVVAQVGTLLLIFIAMQNPVDWPVDSFPSQNGRDSVFALLAHHEELNPWEIRDVDSEIAQQEVRELFDELRELLNRNNVVWLDWRTDDLKSFDKTQGDHFNLLRHLAIALGRHARAEWEEGQRSESIQHDLLLMQLGQAMQKNGTLLEAQGGKAFEDIASGHLTDNRNALRTGEIRRIVPFLEQLAASREPIDVLLRRDEAFSQRTMGWRLRLRWSCVRLTNNRDEYLKGYVFAFQQRDVRVSLLRADLAVRSYQQKHGEFPENLAALVPQDLTTLPADPFTGNPLVYRKAANDFVLYSVGRDGVDDGGKFGRYGDLFKAGVDIDLDAWTRGYD